MPDATTDPAAAYLADVRKRWDVFGEGDATPHLVAALEAVLALTSTWHPDLGGTAALAQEIDRAISAALPGEEADRG